MAFNSLDQLLQKILAQPEWEKQRRFSQLTQCWFQIINPKIAQNSRPLYLRDNILYISTSSSVWSQQLSLQRYSLLKKINRRFPQPLKDLSFSSGKWFTDSTVDNHSPELNNVHPSLININDQSSTSDTQRSPLSSLSSSSPKPTPTEAMEQWWEKLQANTQHLPTCPQCQSPSPEGELKRWGICACCFAQRGN